MLCLRNYDFRDESRAPTPWSLLDSASYAVLANFRPCQSRELHRTSDLHIPCYARRNSTARPLSETLALKPASSHAMACACPALRELSLPHHALNL
jgi:hypothetical protein